jgi:hypothetical protein
MGGDLASETSPVMVVPSAGDGGPPVVLVDREHASAITVREAKMKGVRRIVRSG